MIGHLWQELTRVDGAPHEGPDDARGGWGRHRLALHLHQLSHHAHLAAKLIEILKIKHILQRTHDPQKHDMK